MLDMLPKMFSQKDMLEYKNRVQLLERVKLQSPKLSFEDEAKWEDLKQFYAKNVGKIYNKDAGKFTGAFAKRFIDEVNKVLQGLGTFYAVPTDYNMKKKDGEANPKFTKKPNKDAFNEYVKMIHSRVDKSMPASYCQC